MPDHKKEALRNLAERMRLSNRKQVDPLDVLRLSQGKVSRLLSGKNPFSIDQQAALAAYFGCSIAELFLPVDDRARETFFARPLASVPLMDVNVIRAVGAEALGAVIKNWRGPRMFVPEASESYFAFEQSDRGMSRVIPAGAILIVDMCLETIEAGKVYLVRYGGQIIARRVAGEGERRRLEPDSLDAGFEPIYFDAQPAPEFMGVVRGSYQRLGDPVA